MTDSKPLILESDDGAVRFVTLNRPGKANALNQELLAQFDEAMARARDDGNVRVVVICGAGKGFSSGNDVDEAVAQAQEHEWHREPIADYRYQTRLMRRWLDLWEFPKPTIAQVHGYCIGRAMQLATVCDITIIAEDAEVRQPSIRGGGGQLSPMWVHLVGAKRAKEMSFISGSSIDGKTAAAWGWANRAVPAAELEAVVLEMARKIAYSSPDILEIKKAAINRMVEGAGFRELLLTCGLNNAVLHGSDVGLSRMRTLGEQGLRAANAQWTSELDAAAAGERPSARP
jgi:enoyl-CoA hydratase